MSRVTRLCQPNFKNQALLGDTPDKLVHSLKGGCGLEWLKELFGLTGRK